MARKNCPPTGSCVTEKLSASASINQGRHRPDPVQGMTNCLAPLSKARNRAMPTRMISIARIV